MFRAILLAVDGSEFSEKAIPIAGELAKAFQGEVIVCHVREHEVMMLDVSDVRSEGDELADGVARVLKDAGIGARPDHRATVMGRVAEEILMAATDHGADIIVMGSRGLGEFRGLLIGSVTHKVIHGARCPVLVVK